MMSMRPEKDNRKETRREKPKKEFDELLLEVRRVTRVTTWGRRLSFRATILVWNKKGKIGLGISKGNDVASAVQKASHEAYKNLFEVPLTKHNTVPYPISLKYKACLNDVPLSEPFITESLTTQITTPPFLVISYRRFATSLKTSKFHTTSSSYDLALS